MLMIDGIINETYNYHKIQNIRKLWRFRYFDPDRLGRVAFKSKPHLILLKLFQVL